MDNLPFLVLLGRDTPGLSALVQTVVQEVDMAEEDRDTEEETSSEAEGYDLVQSTWVLYPRFLRDQQTDDTLDWLREDLAVSEGATVNQRRVHPVPPH